MGDDSGHLPAGTRRRGDELRVAAPGQWVWAATMLSGAVGAAWVATFAAPVFAVGAGALAVVWAGGGVGLLRHGVSAMPGAVLIDTGWRRRSVPWDRIAEVTTVEVGSPRTTGGPERVVPALIMVDGEVVELEQLGSWLRRGPDGSVPPTAAHARAAALERYRRGVP